MIEELKKLIEGNGGRIGCYGVEREMLRVDDKGRLSQEKHPVKLGNKFHNRYITTDFSESQIEVITPPFSNVEKTYDFVKLLYDITAVSIGDEYLWPNSMPCIIEDEIPVAEFGEGADAKSLTEYRERLLKKYGGKKQLISGIHLNFSYDDIILEGLYNSTDKEKSYDEFKNSIYLKTARNYLRYRWLLVYLICNTSTLHKSYIDACKCFKCFDEVAVDSYSHRSGVSYRNGECGYRNLIDIFPDYGSVEGYVGSLKEFIKDGLIDSHKELYSQIRLKPSDPSNFLDSLMSDGIKYLEYRTIDINPFERCGVALADLKFIEMFNIYLLLKEESGYERWQEEALDNQDKIAKFGKESIMLKKDGVNIKKEDWALEILDDAEELCKKVGVYEKSIFDEMRKRVLDVENTYAFKIEKRVEEMGYVEAFLSLSKQYKAEAYEMGKRADEYKSISVVSVNDIKNDIVSNKKIDEFKYKL